MRIVVDTNVFVSSFFGGRPRRVVELWRTGRSTLCLSQAVIDEYVRVLIELDVNPQALEELVRLFSTGFNLVFSAKTPEVKVVEADPDDDKFIGCALATGADFIVTGDKALLAVGEHEGVRILSPAGFLEAISD